MALAATKLRFFLEYESNGKWKTAKHLDLLCSKLELVESGQLLRLMVFLPPRHGKSEATSKKFPAWFLGRNPDEDMIISSYAAELAYDFSRSARNTLREWGHIWGVELASDSQAAGRWGIKDHRGGLIAAGVGGPITGRGAKVAIIDDPFKNWEEATSETVRENVWNWYRSTLRTRLAPGGAIILIQTRWHEDDLAGRLLAEAENGGEQWHVVSLPAEAEDGDILGRQPGDFLWPERYPPQEYRDIKKAIGSQLWAALYQQRPSPLEGGIFRRSWWQFYRQAPDPSKFQEIIQSWDCAFKDEKASRSGTPDYVVGQVWGRIGADKYLLDQVRDRMSFVETVQAIRTLTAKWPQARTKLIEDTANGPAVIATLQHEISGMIPVKPEGGKLVRAQAVSPDVEAGNVYLPDPSIAGWVHDFIEECAAFPNGANDDQCDAMSQALIRMNGGRSALIRPQEHARIETLPQDGTVFKSGMPFVTPPGNVFPVPAAAKRRSASVPAVCPECGATCTTVRNQVDLKAEGGPKTIKTAMCQEHGWFVVTPEKANNVIAG